MNLAWLKRPIRKPLRAQIPAIDVAQLLGRKPVDLDTPELQRFLAGKRVMVTGAGGSIGSEIRRQTMRFFPPPAAPGGGAGGRAVADRPRAAPPVGGRGPRPDRRRRV